MKKCQRIVMLIVCVWAVFTVHADDLDITVALCADTDVESVEINSDVLSEVFQGNNADIQYMGIFNSRNNRGASRMQELVGEFIISPGVEAFAMTENTEEESSVTMYVTPSAAPGRYATIMIVNSGDSDVCVIFIKGDLSLEELAALQPTIPLKHEN